MTPASVKVAFLIDEQSLMNSTLSMVELISCILRILIFYRSHSPDLLWGFRFFSTITNYTSYTTRKFQPLSIESIQNIQTEYTKRESERPNSTTAGSAIARIQQLMKDTIGDFNWNSSGLNSSNSPKNFIFIITGGPSDIIQAHDFFIDKHDQSLHSQHCPKDFLDGPPVLISEIFQPVEKEIAESFLAIYAKSQISVSLIDTTPPIIVQNAFDFDIDRRIRLGWRSLFGLFNGNYIRLKKVTEDNSAIGHSFLSVLPNYLPFTWSKKKFPLPDFDETIAPSWKGSFTMIDNTIIGQFSLFAATKSLFTGPHFILYTDEIRLTGLIHTSQFSSSWLSQESTNHADQCFKLIHRQGDADNETFGYLLEKLQATSSLGLVELIPLEGYPNMKRRAVIEPLGIHSANLTVLNDNQFTLPEYAPMETEDVQQYISFDEVLAGITHEYSFAEISCPENTEEAELAVSPPDFIVNKLKQRARKKAEKIARNTPKDKEQPMEEELVITLPNDATTFGKLFKKLYLEVMYLQKYHLEVVITIIQKQIDHVLERGVPVIDVINALKTYALTTSELDMKHQKEILKAELLPYSTGSSETHYQIEWWRLFKSYEQYDKNFRDLSLTFLRLKEAQLQVILYVFISKLVEDNSMENMLLDPQEEAKSFFLKTVLILYHNKIEDFILELDSDEGIDAINSRDPCDLLDSNLALLLEKKFDGCLKELIANFKECACNDDLQSIPDDGEEDMFAEQLAAEKKQKESEPDSHANPVDHKNTSKTQSKTNSKGKLKDLLPAKPTRSSSNPLDHLLKRTITVSRTNSNDKLSDTAKQAISRVERSKVDGKPTMKRVGSFIKSALSPKRPKYNPEREGNATIIRSKSAYDPSITPRTSLNRFLNTDVFAEFSEYCVSPTREDMSAMKRIPSAYPKPTSFTERLERYPKPTSFTEHLEGFNAGQEMSGSDDLSIPQKLSIDDLFKDEDSD